MSVIAIVTLKQEHNDVASEYLAYSPLRRLLHEAEKQDQAKGPSLEEEEEEEEEKKPEERRRRDTAWADTAV